MAICTLTVRIIDQWGVVQDVRQAPFYVLGPDEDSGDAQRELLDRAEQLERLAEQIGEARFDKQHRHHHWWMP